MLIDYIVSIYFTIIRNLRQEFTFGRILVHVLALSSQQSVLHIVLARVCDIVHHRASRWHDSGNHGWELSLGIPRNLRVCHDLVISILDHGSICFQIWILIAYLLILGSLCVADNILAIRHQTIHSAGRKYLISLIIRHQESWFLSLIWREEILEVGNGRAKPAHIFALLVLSSTSQSFHGMLQSETDSGRKTLHSSIPQIKLDRLSVGIRSSFKLSWYVAAEVHTHSFHIGLSWLQANFCSSSSCISPEWFSLYSFQTYASSYFT